MSAFSASAHKTSREATKRIRSGVFACLPVWRKEIFCLLIASPGHSIRRQPTRKSLSNKINGNGVWQCNPCKSWLWSTMSSNASPHLAHPQDSIDPSIEVTEPIPPEEDEGQPSSSNSNSNAEASPQPTGQSKSKSPSAEAGPPTPPNAWQAIFSPQHNAYYFYNVQTNETTWTNPLPPLPAAGSAEEPTSSSAEAQAGTSTSTSQSPQPEAKEPLASTSSTSHYAALQAAAQAAGIDPSLAYLDPSLVGGPVGAGGSAPNTFTAKFNARTGAFTAGGARDPGHLSEFEVSVRFFCIIVSILSRSVFMFKVPLTIHYIFPEFRTPFLFLTLPVIAIDPI
jgi:hypothetical protein